MASIDRPAKTYLLLLLQNRTRMQQDFHLSAYDYHLPPENIAQHPTDRRDGSRLLVLEVEENKIHHHRFAGISGLIDDRDMLVVNDTRVFPARLSGRKQSGGKIEVFLLEFPTANIAANGSAWVTALLKCSKRPKPGSRLVLGNQLSCTVLELLDGGKARLELHFDPASNISEILRLCGQIPLPPYISRLEGTTAEDAERYQTVYADRPGAVAAPTAGLHFTAEILEALEHRGVELGKITLHVGYGTFAPVRAEQITEHSIHEEFVTVPADTVEKIRKTKARGGRIWAVGTTTVRALEYAALNREEIEPAEGWCGIYIYPGFRFRVIDNLITNFHLPNSSLMFLVAALCGRQTLLDCYREAIREGYRFFSYGDAMAVVAKKPAAEHP